MEVTVLCIKGGGGEGGVTTQRIDTSYLSQATVTNDSSVAVIIFESDKYSSIIFYFIALYLQGQCIQCSLAKNTQMPTAKIRSN